MNIFLRASDSLIRFREIAAWPLVYPLPTIMVTSLPTPSAPKAAFVKLVAILKKYTIPSSLQISILDISVFGILTVLITTSANSPFVASLTFSRISTAFVASALIYTSARPASFTLWIVCSLEPMQITLPVTPAFSWLRIAKHT